MEEVHILLREKATLVVVGARVAAVLRLMNVSHPHAEEWVW